MLGLVVTVAAANDHLGGSLALTSDYRLYGLSQSDGEPAAQVEVHYQSSANARSTWFGGLWASSVKLGGNEPTSVQLEAFLGHQWAFDADWQGRVSLAHYAHPWNSLLHEYDYDELSAGIAWRDALSFTVTWSPNTDLYARYHGFSENRTALAYEGTGRLPLWRTLALIGGLGYRDLQDLFGRGYWYGSTGLSYDRSRLHLSLLWVDTDHTARRLFVSDAAGPAWVATALWTF